MDRDRGERGRQFRRGQPSTQPTRGGSSYVEKKIHTRVSIFRSPSQKCLDIVNSATDHDSNRASIADDRAESLCEANLPRYCPATLLGEFPLQRCTVSCMVAGDRREVPLGRPSVFVLQTLTPASSDVVPQFRWAKETTNAEDGAV